MKRTRTIFLLPCVVIVAACGAAVEGGTTVAGGEGQTTVAGPGPAGKRRGFEGPAETFRPSHHPPRKRFAPAPPPPLGSLPPLKMRLRECLGLQEEKEAQIAAPSPGWGGAGKGGSKPTQKKAQPAPAGGGALGAVSGGGGGSAGSAQAPMYSSPPPSQPSPTPAAKPAKPKEPSGPKKAAESVPPPPKAPETKARASAPAADMAAAPAEAARYEAPASPEPPSAVRIAGGEDDERTIAVEEDPDARYDDWGQSIYLSNDDTMSLSSAQRVIYAIDHFLPLPIEHIRPHELLNYFSFQTAPVEPSDDFSVLADIAPDDREPGIYTLALAVRGRTVTRESRRNAEITLVIDRSGSMSDEGRMDYLKRGLRRMVDELKTGDIVHMVLFDHEVCVPMESFVVGRDSLDDLRRAIDAIEPRGSTDLHRGLSRGYEIADRDYQAEYTNRVILITDALANTGVTDERTISMISKYYDTRRIRLSGVGVGREFNDSLLDRLTERGKGAYVFLGSEAEVEAVFGDRFVSLIETTALDVHFLLHLPRSLRMNVFYGEESSTVKEDVQAIHYFANTSQLFLSDLMARGGTLRPQDGIMLGIEYEDPESGEKLLEEYAFTLGDIQGEAFNVRKGRLIMAWIDMLAQMAARPLPPEIRYTAGMWVDEEGWKRCEEGRSELARLAEGLDDPEVRRVLDLWDKHCSRYERPRRPSKRQIAAPEPSWPSARPEPER